MSVVEALAREVGSIGKALRRLRAREWEAPTRCPPMTVSDLVAHVLRGAARIEELLDAEPLQIEPERDGRTYWDYDRAATDPRIVSRAQQAAAAAGGPEGLVKAWDEGWGRALRRAREGEPAAVYPTIMGAMRFEEYLITRVVEVTVHHMDIDDALGRDAHPDAEALRIVADVLRARLGTDLRDAGVQDVRFVLIGTGRAPLDERERGMLGPLADSFPLLA